MSALIAAVVALLARAVASVGRVRRPLLRIVAVAALLGGSVASVATVEAKTPAGQRVVLADPDPELLRAVVAALAPWHLEVVVVAAVPADAEGARTEAESERARFVVWRSGAVVIVFDRETGVEERRDTGGTGALDPVDAATTALTVKTLMRLPPPETVAPPTAETGVEVRLHAGLATRIARGSDTSVSARFVGLAAVRPTPRLGLRIGAAADVGTATDIDRAGFKGTWKDWSLVGVASWAFVAGVWEVEPYTGAGFARSSFAGVEMGTPQDDTATLGVACGGMWVRRRVSAWTLGAGMGLELRTGTPTYTRSGGNNQMIFEVPSFALDISLAASADFGR